MTASSPMINRTRALATVRRVADVRAAVRRWRSAGESVAFVPTMGSLHDGHVSLAALAAAECDRVVASIFVNPTQFGPSEDFAAYPRTLAQDTARLDSAGTVDLLFVPDVSEVYPFGLEHAVRISLPPLSRELDGASRPGHFDGVASVVCRLLNIVTPDVLVLGQKDCQQVTLLKIMIEDLRLPVAVRVGATLREPDGLAMSSRNRYLDAEQRQRASELNASLQRVRVAVRAGEKEFATLERRAVNELAHAGFKPDYVEVRRAADLQKPSASDRAEDLVVLGAAWLGRARLIDNVRI
jgi:pantoate--beta-alanine ligase